MRRRHLLSVLSASAVSLSGCVGSLGFDGSADDSATTPGDSATTAPGDSATPGSSTTPDDRSTTSDDPITLSVGETFETDRGGTLTVEGVRIRKSIVSGGVHFDPVVLPDRQFVVAHLSVSSPGAGTTGRTDYLRSRELDSRFRVTLDGTRYPGDDRVFHVVPRSDDPEGVRLGFPVPAPATVERGSVVWTTGVPEVRWSLTADHRDALARPPQFEVREFAVPDEVTRGSTFDATLTVANVGSGDGTFLAELGATTISDTPEIRIDVSAGETVTAKRAVEPYYPEESDEMTLVLNWDVGQSNRTVSITD